MTSTLKSLCLVFFMTFAAPMVMPFFVGSAWAQAGKFPPLDPEILQKARGKVAVVFYWSTTCAVCRDSLPEFAPDAEDATLAVVDSGALRHAPAMRGATWKECPHERC